MEWLELEGISGSKPPAVGWLPPPDQAAQDLIQTLWAASSSTSRHGDWQTKPFSAWCYVRKVTQQPQNSVVISNKMQ